MSNTPGQVVSSDHFGIVHREEGVEVGYVEEDDEEGEESAGETDEHHEAQLGGLRQGGPCSDEAGQTRY